MLYNVFLTFKFFRFSQAGYYFDYFFKNLSEAFIRNVFIYSAQFFGEKYMIEVFTKKILSNSIYKLNNFWSWSQLYYINFFIQLISFFFYFLSIINLLYLI